MIPPRFEYGFYIKDKDWFASETEAKQHFESVGVPNGLAGSHATDQGNFVRLISRLQPDNMLEMGPGCAPKLHGDNVRYFDVKSATELRDRYRDDPRNKNIPDKIHFVSEEGNLNVVKEKFDIIFSSHMIEHSLDLIDHLNSVHSLLNPGGYYFIIAPNKRYTFDYFKPLSLAEDVIAHHVACNGTPSLPIRSILLEKFKRTHNDALRHWSGDHGSPDFESVRKSGRYQDKSCCTKRFPQLDFFR